MLLFDEFGSLAGGGPGYQHRGAGQVVGRWVLLSAQSAAGLGSEPERERLLAASSAVVLFRSPMPAGGARPGRVRTHPRGRLVVARWHRCST